jgi:hypothetical protein
VLDHLATSLVEWHGWWDAEEAANFVLAGDPPSGRRIRTNIIVRDRAGATRVIIEADPRASPQAVADSYRRARSKETLERLNLPATGAQHHRLDGARPNAVTAKNSALALHLARNRHATWAERRTLWNQRVRETQPGWSYPNRRRLRPRRKPGLETGRRRNLRPQAPGRQPDLLKHPQG